MNKKTTLPATDGQLASGQTVTGTYDLSGLAEKLDKELLKLASIYTGPKIKMH